MRNVASDLVNKFPYGFYIAGGIVFLFLAIKIRSFAIVNAGKRGVVMQFGKVQDKVLDEGIHPIMPIIYSDRLYQLQHDQLHLVEM